MTSGLAVATGIALVVALAWIVSLSLPGSNAIRLRNAFLLRRGRPEDFAWKPSLIPPGFRVEKGAAPVIVGEAIREAGVGEAEGDWSRARALVGALIRYSRREGGIRMDISRTFERIVNGDGYCADYVRVYLAASRCVDLFCRQWSFSFDGFGGHGHTFVEIYDRKRDGWVFLDVHNNVYAVLAGNETIPLDAITLRQSLLSSPQSVRFLQAAPGRLGYPEADKLVEYYVRGAGQWYLWWGNDVISRERRWPTRSIVHLSGALAHRLEGLFGGLPPLVVLATAENERSIRRMESLRSTAMTAVGLALAMVAALVLQLAIAQGGAAR